MAAQAADLQLVFVEGAVDDAAVAGYIYQSDG